MRQTTVDPQQQSCAVLEPTVASPWPQRLLSNAFSSAWCRSAEQDMRLMLALVQCCASCAGRCRVSLGVLVRKVVEMGHAQKLPSTVCTSYPHWQGASLASLARTEADTARKKVDCSQQGHLGDPTVRLWRFFYKAPSDTSQRPGT